jgi:sugar phosphate isomerase/epimerase
MGKPPKPGAIQKYIYQGIIEIGFGLFVLFETFKFMNTSRRNILRGLGLLPLLLTNYQISSRSKKTSKARIRYSVNAYSFNDELRNGSMTLLDMMEFAADIGLDAVDLTAYYFSTYPDVPPDKELFQMKRTALRLGLDISWTGVRNDFVNPDKKSREADKLLIKKWLEASVKLGSPIMRIFAGRVTYEGHTKDEVKKWLVEELKSCAAFGQSTGVLPALQHHNDFLYTSDEVIDILNRVNSAWLGLILDVGSLRQGDPYEEIEILAPYADYWFIKEFVYRNEQQEPVNMDKLSKIIIKTGYTGYVSFESLSDNDPRETVNSMFTSFKKAMENSLQ